jgi:hypothetical protein
VARLVREVDVLAVEEVGSHQLFTTQIVREAMHDGAEPRLKHITVCTHTVLPHEAVL